ncbi:GntR family transcriptional regulator [Pedobacter sp. MC2016-05]|uniref:GntR family transcriptional regulator n=1 Tax=Pedobacter sp. MC2016-05 TaxID=2994474 RepID=UPI0022452958|nr:GntR family transcriptional regulator [Pedobacter sp. MC2016-05]MCX2476064.1 GntR family transcriptional regulator [Pedobacter sp. MC2016-05]
MDYQFNIQGHLKISKLDQLCRHLIAAILSGEILPGMQLPSITSLAKINRISRDTTEKAYRRLTHLGYIESVAGRGHFANIQPEGSPSADPADKNCRCSTSHLSKPTRLSPLRSIPLNRFAGK